MAKQAKSSSARGAAEAPGRGDHDPHDTVGSLVRDLYLEYRRGLQRELQTMEVSLPQWTFLRILWQGDGLTQKAISDRASIHPSTSVDTLRALERENLIERRPDPDDARAWRVYLTRKGRDLRPLLLPCAGTVNAQALRGFAQAEVDVLRQLLARALSNLQQGS